MQLLLSRSIEVELNQGPGTMNQLTTTDFYTLAPSKHKQLRDLNKEFSETQAAWNHALASVTRAMKLNEQNYHRKRKAILNANGHSHPGS
jgi:hypothetical protein